MTHDLADLSPAAESRYEIGLLDVGAPASRPALQEGWSFDESEGETSFTWGLGTASEIEVFIVPERSLELAFRCRPLVFPGAEPQTLTLELDGETVATLVLEPRWQTYRLTLPAAEPNPGVRLRFHRLRFRRLRLRYGRAHSPRELGLSEDARSLAVAWDWLPFDGAESAFPGPRREAERLFLPWNSEVDFFLELAAGSVFTATDLTLRGEGRLEAKPISIPAGLPSRVMRISSFSASRRYSLRWSSA